jgi:hypothetical protein
MALSLVGFLEADRGFSALVEVLERLGRGEAIDAALARTFGDGHAALCRRWADRADGDAP